MQLKFAHDIYGNLGLPYRSYLRVDRVYEADRGVLLEYMGQLGHLRLKQGSYKMLLDFMRRKGTLGKAG